MDLCKGGFNYKFKAKINCRSKTNTTLNYTNITKSILQPLESLLTF